MVAHLFPLGRRGECQPAGNWRTGGVPIFNSKSSKESKVFWDATEAGHFQARCPPLPAGRRRVEDEGVAGPTQCAGRGQGGGRGVFARLAYPQ